MNYRHNYRDGQKLTVLFLNKKKVGGMINLCEIQSKSGKLYSHTG